MDKKKEWTPEMRLLSRKMYGWDDRDIEDIING